MSELEDAIDRADAEYARIDADRAILDGARDELETVRETVAELQASVRDSEEAIAAAYADLDRRAADVAAELEAARTQEAS